MDASITLLKEASIGMVADELFGSFLEHLGRAIYTGIYEPGHPLADEQGYRRDTLELVRELRIPIVRYPGGNFLSGYDWRDGIGPRGRRPVRLERAWHSIETNAIGIDDFCDWARKAGAAVMAGVNMGTGSPQDAADMLEYCNHPGGTTLSDMRAANGHPLPHGIKYWCIGNEMDGDWQIGHMDAAAYGRKARETLKLMRWTDDTIKTVVCGSSSPEMPTWPEWDRIVLEHTYDLADYLSIHRYYENRGDDDSFLASHAGLSRFIETSIATCDYVKALKRSGKTMMLSLDEWNVWYQSRQEPHPWRIAPRLIEDRYSLLDALALGGMATALLNHADRVRIGCLAQLVNAIAPIVAEPGGPAWRQTTYYPFRDVSLHGRGLALRPLLDSPVKETMQYGEVQTLAVAATQDVESGVVSVFVLNSDMERGIDTSIDLASFGRTSMTSRTELSGPDPSAVNSATDPFAVRPATLPVSQPDGGKYAIRLAPASWNVLQFATARPAR